MSKKVKAKVLIRQMVETYLTVTVQVPDEADDYDILDTVIDETIEGFKDGIGVLELTPEQAGWNNSQLRREVLDPEVPVIGEPKGTWSGAPGWTADEVVQILAVN